MAAADAYILCSIFAYIRNLPMTYAFPLVVPFFSFLGINGNFYGEHGIFVSLIVIYLIIRLVILVVATLKLSKDENGCWTVWGILLFIDIALEALLVYGMYANSNVLLKYLALTRDCFNYYGIGFFALFFEDKVFYRMRVVILFFLCLHLAATAVYYNDRFTKLVRIKEAESNKKTHCPYCGHELKEINEPYCPHCGKKH